MLCSHHCWGDHRRICLKCWNSRHHICGPFNGMQPIHALPSPPPPLPVQHLWPLRGLPQPLNPPVHQPVLQLLPVPVQQQQLQPLQAAPLPVQQQQQQPPVYHAMQQETIYAVTGSEQTTAYNLRMQLQVNGESWEFKGDASGIFTTSANPLQRGRLRTKDLQALGSRGTLFYFDFHPNRFEVRFYDPDNTTSPLGVLHADPIAPAGNPGSGVGKWYSLF